MADAHDVFLALHRDTGEQASALVAQVAVGEIGPRQFGELLAAVLEEAHTEAVVIGRQHAGDPAPLEADDRAFAARIVDGEAEFLAGFVRDLEQGRYEDRDGNFRVVQAQQRAGYYSNRLTGSANEAWTLTLPPETTLIYWHLNQSAHSHCGDCPSLASRSPYASAELPTRPGEGQTACIMQCRCWLQTGGGERGFSIPD